MPVAAMQKVAVLGHIQIQNEVLAYFQKSEMLEIAALPSNGQKAPATEPGRELELADLESTIRLLESFSGKKKSFIETFAPPKEAVTEEMLVQMEREFDWRNLIAKIKAHEAELANLKNLENTLRSDLEALYPWRGLKVRLDQLVCSSKICVVAGTCKTKELAAFKRKLEKFSPAVEAKIVDSAKEKSFLLIFYLTDESKVFFDFLSKTNFEKVSLAATARTPAEEIRYLEQLLRQARAESKNLLQEIKSQVKNQANLAYIYDHLFQQNLKMLAREKLAHTEKTFVLTGWVPQKKFNKLGRELQKITPLVEVRPIEPAANEIPPTLVENPKIFYPFELITRIFGLPAQNEIDPTAPLSFFYLLFFAMCLSDVGYGAILSLLSYYYLRRLTLSEGGKKLLLLLFWGGIATIFAGIATGSYFGIDLNQLPPALSDILKRLQVIDPVKNPLNVLILSLFLGVIQNLYGVSLAMYWKMKNRAYLDAILDDGLWIYFLTCLVLLVAAAGLNSPLAGFFGKLSIAGAILLVLSQGRREPGIFKKAIFGVLSLYRTTGYLGDTLSYSRLLALMMTTSIIGMVVNIIAGLTKNSVPILGYLFMIAILFFGHVFNLVVSVLGAFIHSTRLQLVEFFGKFYGNGGREFKPFRRETKYVIIK